MTPVTAYPGLAALSLRFGLVKEEDIHERRA
jgi:hypothetical protein